MPHQTTVTWAGTQLAEDGYTVESATRIIVHAAPAAAQDGPVQVVVTTVNGASGPATYTYVTVASYADVAAGYGTYATVAAAYASYSDLAGGT